MRSILTLLLLTLATPALAVDGVLEINFTCAVKTGCFSGDTAGFPVTITVPGSYRLTSNLSIGLLPAGSQNGNFITISADDVTLDLGGFRISCRDAFGGPFCSGFGDGVHANAVGGTSVKNGSIRGMNGDGVSISERSEVTNLRVYSNGRAGIQTGNEAKISGNIVTENGTRGIFAGDHSIVSDNLVFHNGGDGIDAIIGSAVQRNVVRENGGFGLQLSGSSAYHANVITDNVMGPLALPLGANRGDNFCRGNNVVLDTCP
jgi:hypothetical protein